MRKTMKKHSIAIWTIGLLLGVYALSMLSVLLWGIMSSFKGDLAFALDPISFPKKFEFSNYSLAWKVFYIRAGKTIPVDIYIEEMLLNSVLYAGGSAIVQATVQFIMAYVSARFAYKYGKVIYTIVILGMIIPLVGTEPSALAMASALNLRDSILGMYVMKGYFLGMYFLVFYEMLKAFPKDYDEAAYIDGASNLTVLTKIIAPLSATTYFTVVLLLFVGYWNDYTTPLLYMPNIPTAAYGLLTFWTNPQSSEAANIPVQLAASALMLIPTLVIFLAFHKKLLANITIGGVKE